MKPAIDHEMPFELDEIGRISATLVDALREAHAMAQGGHYGADFNELVRHAREMSDLLTEALDHAEPAVDGTVRDFAATLVASIQRMERAVASEDER